MDSSSRSTSKSGQYRCSRCNNFTFNTDVTFASLNQGKTLKDKKYSSPRTWSHKPCFEIPTTSPAEVLFPSVDDFIFPVFYDALNFSKLLTLQAVIVCQFYDRFQPKLRFAVAAPTRNKLSGRRVVIRWPVNGRMPMIPVVPVVSRLGASAREP